MQLVINARSFESYYVKEQEYAVNKLFRVKMGLVTVVITNYRQMHLLVVENWYNGGLDKPVN